LLNARLENQKLTGSTLRRAEEVVRWFGAVQAQDYIGAKWALALRTRGLTDHDVELAFAEGRILRTHVLRPTWHFVTRDDVRWLLALTGPRVQRINRAYARKWGLTDRTLARARSVIERALTDSQAATREELSAELRRAGIDATGQRLAHLLMDLELEAVICSGPRRGKQFTYALLDERAPKGRELRREAALCELTSRYFKSHGPATLRDFAWWSGLSLSEARQGAVLAQVDPLTEPPRAQRASGADYLLPNYDEYLIAYKDRRAVVDPTRVRNLGVFTSLEYPHHVVLHGRVAGSWRRTVSVQSLTVDVRPYQRLTRLEADALTDQASRYGRFLDLAVEVRIE
jgi:hypothetical protein